MPSQAALRALLTDPLAPWGVGAFFAADLINNRCKLGGRYVGRLESIPGISITRATTGYALTQTGALQSFPSGSARITDRGLLCEGSATNLCLQSQTFETTWSVSRCLAFGSGSVADAIAAPDGTLTADKVVEDTTASNTHSILQSFTKAASATTYTVSVFAKAAERSSFQLYIYGTTTGDRGAAQFDLSAGTVSVAAASFGTFSAASATITALANGWYRCAVTATTDTATALSVRVFLGDSPTSVSYTGDGSSGIYLWGAQLETGVATSYIPTTTGSATRNADVISVGSVTGLSYPVTLFAEFERAADTGAAVLLLQVDDGSTANRAFINIGSADTFQGQTDSSSVNQSTPSVAGALAVGTIYRGALRVATNDVIACRGGTLSTQDTSATNPASPTTIRIGSNSAGTAQAAAYLRRLAVFPSAYANAALQALAPA